jgi:phosphate-selective porin OprO and OprP
MRGRMQLDAAYQNFGSGIQDVARQSNEFPDYGVILRRVRLGALGIMRENWEWQIEADFSENEVDLANVYIAYLMDHGRLAVGHFKEPFGMEYATSSRYITFMERSAAADAYKVNREPGIMYETIQPNWYVGAGLFGRGIDYNREVQEGWAVSLRGSFAPYLSGTDFVHFGAGVNRRQNALDKDLDEYLPVRLRAREGTRAIDARLVGRDDIEGVKNFTRSNLEFAAGFGSWWAQAEYYRVNLNLDPERGDVRVPDDSLTLDGWYVQTGFFLTGETKNYRAFSGDFGQQLPNNNFNPRNGNWGAFELAFRYSVADSREHSRAGRGQKLEHYTAGLNWYFTPEVLMKLNIMYMEGERDVFKDDGWVYGMRFQYIF